MRMFGGVVALMVFAVVTAHACCYSDSRTLFLVELSNCWFEVWEYVEWKEYQPTSHDPSHGHEWVSGSYATGPLDAFRDPDCQLGIRLEGGGRNE